MSGSGVVPVMLRAVGIETEQDARQFLTEPRERFAKLGLELHPDKIRLVEFGRNAAGEHDQWPLPRTTVRPRSTTST